MKRQSKTEREGDYKLSEIWSPYLGALLIVIVIAALGVEGLWWGVFGGVKLWGDYLNNLMGLGSVLGLKEDLADPLLHRISLMDICLMAGAFSAALFARQFKIVRAPMQEYVTGAFGGTLMGVGASLAGGCTVGGFVTPLIFASPVGWSMAVGLLIGAFVGLKLLVWILANVTWGVAAPTQLKCSPYRRFQPLLGLVVLMLVLAWAVSWHADDDLRLAKRGIVIVAGFVLGFVLLRSRFCISRVFRDPFMTSDGTMAKAMILLLAAGMLVGAALIQANTVDPLLAIPPTFWFGSLVGGIIFGIGMMLAGGCASGALWRLGEGQTKLWVAVLFFSWSGSTFSALVNRWDLLTREMSMELVEVTKVGYQVYLPDIFGNWAGVFVFSFCSLVGCYLLVRYSESTKRFSVI